MNAGRVELDLVAVGKDQVTAMLRQVDAQMKATAAGMKTAATDTNTLGAKLDGLKGQAAGVNKVREAFENLRSNFFFVAAGAAAVVASVAAIAQALNTNNVAIAQWEAVSKSVNPAIESTKDAVRALREELGELAPRTNLELILGGLEKQLISLTEKLEKADGGVIALQGNLDIIAAYDFAGLATTLGAVESIEKQRNDALTKAADLTETLIDATNRYVAALNRVPNDANTFVGPSPNLAPNDANTFVGPTGTGTTPRPPRGGGRAQAQTKEEGLDALFGRGKWAEKDNPLTAMLAGFESEGDAIDKMIARVADLGNELGEGDGKSGIAVKVDEVAAAFDRLAGASSSLDQILPGLSSTFSQIAAIWKETDGSAKSLASGVVGSVDAIATAGAAWIKDEKARTRFLGAKELLLAAPMYFYDPAQAAVKTATGLGLLALAGGGGGGGGARGGGSGSRGSEGSGGGGPTTNIFHFSTLVTDGQQVTTAVNRAQRSSRGTGQAARSGV